MLQDWILIVGNGGKVGYLVFCEMDYEFRAQNPRDSAELDRMRSLPTKQVMGKWKVKSENLTPLCKEAKELKAMFKHFDMEYIPRKYNSEADAQANRGAYLRVCCSVLHVVALMWGLQDNISTSVKLSSISKTSFGVKLMEEGTAADAAIDSQRPKPRPFPERLLELAVVQTAARVQRSRLLPD
ncbi:hypothetical protein Dsin_031113 [Dipteronia sinensis]|uniref:RNase H type-1 domain-containing protein n=1 Tax=Dipteronia sinensis TaxID=43782 RepID=A0AAE0DS19_9ROSI|nr:hypothetical protein Dsin_031113 [Dipteronia sinensis]